MKIDIVSHEGFFFLNRVRVRMCGHLNYPACRKVALLLQTDIRDRPVYCKQRSMCDSGKDAMYTNSKVFLNEKSG